MVKNVNELNSDMLCLENARKVQQEETKNKGCKTVLIPLTDVHEYHKHTFCIKDDEKMESLAESIAKAGLQEPIKIRESKYPEYNKSYEIISGHRRTFAAKKAGLSKIPAIILDISDDDADIMMVDSNNQREDIKISEKAWGYRVKYDALKRKQGRRESDLKGRTADILAADSSDSARQINMYIRLTYLIKHLLRLVDDNKLSIRPAVEASYLSRENQQTLLDIIYADGVKPTEEGVKALRALETTGEYNVDTARKILLKVKDNPVRSRRAKASKAFNFPASYKGDDEERGDLLQALLDEYFSSHGAE